MPIFHAFDDAIAAVSRCYYAIRYGCRLSLLIYFADACYAAFDDAGSGMPRAMIRYRLIIATPRRRQQPFFAHATPLRCYIILILRLRYFAALPCRRHYATRRLLRCVADTRAISPR